MTWSLEAVRTMDGLRLGDLPMVPLSWSRQVRDGKLEGPHEGDSAQAVSSIGLPYDALHACGVVNITRRGWRRELMHTLMPVMTGAALVWDGLPIILGPFVGTPVLGEDELSVNVGGVTDILAHRVVTPEQFSARARFEYKGLSLGTIAKRVVQQALAKPNGGLPISFEADETAADDADHIRTYNGFNVANLFASDLLSKIANVGGDSVGGVYGPDIDFRPEVVDSLHYGWHMYTGSEHDPWISQPEVHDWEEGSAGTGRLTARFSADQMAHRVYGVGDGQDEGTRVTRVDSQPAEFMPLMETVVSDSQWTTDELVAQHARSALSPAPLMGASLTVRADGAPQLGQFWPGDLARVTTHDSDDFGTDTQILRIQQMQGDETGDVTLTFDPAPMV